MSCQACARPAQQVTSKYVCHARCCSPVCGQIIYDGIRQRRSGHYRVAAVSPLGAAIIARQPSLATCRSFTLPPHVMPALIGALQRIGPQTKRGADDAELPESAQAAAPVTNQGNWLLDRLPAEVWTAVLSSLDRSDLRSFAAASQEAAMLARTETVQVANARRNLTLRRAALEYAVSVMTEPANGAEATATRQRVLRVAFPEAARVALTILLTLDMSTIEALARRANAYNVDVYFSAIDTLRAHADRNGPALFTRPLLLETGEPIMLGAIHVSLAAMNTLGVFASPLMQRFWLHWLALAGDAVDSMHVERHNCIGLFAYMAGESLSNLERLPDVRPSLALPPIIEMVARGLDLRRPGTAAAILTSNDIWHEASVIDVFRRHAAIALNSNDVMALAFTLPPGDTSVCTAVVDLLEQRNQLRALLLTPAGERQETLLFAGRVIDDDDDTNYQWLHEHLRDTVVPAAARLVRANPDAPSPFLVRNAAGQTPFMVYAERMALLHEVVDVTGGTEWRDGFWAPFAPLPDSELPAIVMMLQRHEYDWFRIALRSLSPTVVDNDRIVAVFNYILRERQQVVTNASALAGWDDCIAAIIGQLPATSPRRAALAEYMAGAQLCRRRL